MSEVLKKDREYVWHPFTQMQTAPEPLEILRAKETVLYAADGKEYIDCNSSWWVNVHGHGNEHIGNAISEQFHQIDHVIFAGATHAKGVELAERIVKLLPDNLTKVFFSDNGSTAIEVALKMVFQYWFNKGDAKKRILALDGAYHGDTFGAMAIGQRGYFNKPFEHFFFDVDFLDFPTKENEAALLKKATSLFETNEFAALILEPLVQGSAGMRMYSVEFLNELVSLAKENNVLVILDEVMTAWGRTGKYFAFQHSTIVPDIICLSKGLTGGVLPLGLTIASQEIYTAFLSEDKLKALLHGHSFTGNPLSCAAACASLDLFELEHTWEQIEMISAENKRFQSELVYNAIREIRVTGTILAIELKVNGESSYFAHIRDKAYNYFLENGLLIRPLGNIIFINPPYCISKEQLEKVHNVILSFLETLINEIDNSNSQSEGSSNHEIFDLDF
jgi:adenosylmethionine-8-amino-7-oxononanoate aminotransferase